MDEPLLARALAFHALPRLEAGLRNGSFSEEMESHTQLVEMVRDAAEVSRLRLLAGDDKRCRYLQELGGDEVCRAGWDGTRGVKAALPTTPHICRLCNVPDQRIVCSALHHLTTLKPAGLIRAHRALCGAGREQFRPEECQPGENTCWQRRGDETVPSETIRSPPLALHESFDYLDVVWRNVFGQPLLKLNALEVGGLLATPCSGKDDFHKKVNCIVDTFDAFQVPVASGGSLEKMAVHLKAWGEAEGLTPDDLMPVQQAIVVLKKVARLRAGMLHSSSEPARQSFEDAQVTLGVSLPAVSYADAWDHLVARVTEMLSIVRQFVRSHGQ